MSVHLVGGGFTPTGDPEVTGVFLAEAAARAAGSGRIVPRIGVLLVVADDVPSEGFRAEYPASLRAVAACEPVVTVLVAGERFAPAVLTDIDGLVIGGGLTPAYLAAVDDIVEEIRLLVADGLPYLGFSAGAMIAADRAVIGGWRINGVPVCPEATAEGLDEVTIAEGLGLVDLAVDVHAAQWGTLGRLVAATEAGMVDGGVAIDEGTVLIVADEGFAVHGAGSVWQVLDEPAGVIVGILGA
ncbi:Type 1 glutamine amidotransferase-like domain-containing protein [Homoserinibacter sp. GY 40078]|uniref:Type 1 glutamine amidotransferase-like domain-containing protein n=1 Tax=Homoserinibacter sp. GY 40078 TaxID=2603275 RepID=UPI00164F39E0|nr:Type 1 glutamine amidotransferase-like domain-containing protein [Homoserinibacter sp. GY 40078]